jgi:hypothetical protein
MHNLGWDEGDVDDDKNIEGIAMAWMDATSVNILPAQYFL